MNRVANLISTLEGRVAALPQDKRDDLAAELQVRALPQTILFDTFGRPVHTLVGYLPTVQEFEAILARLPAISKGEL
jgi:thioredoxin-related protein